MVEHGKERWVLIKKTEDMSNPGLNSSHHTVRYNLHPSLEKAIKENPSTVLAVKIFMKVQKSLKSSSSACTTNESECDSLEHLDYSSSTTITYDGATENDKDIEFLYVSGQERWIIEQGQEITLTDTSYLLRERDIAQLRSSIETSQQKLDELLAEQREYQCSTNQF